MIDHRRLKTRYPNIKDLHIHIAFEFTTNGRRRTNKWGHFWNYVGAGHIRPSKYECEICGSPVKVRTQRKYCVCQKCLHKYMAEVRNKQRIPKPLIRMVAA